MTEEERLLVLLEEAKQNREEAEQHAFLHGYTKESLKRILDAGRERDLIYGLLEKERERKIME